MLNALCSSNGILILFAVGLNCGGRSKENNTYFEKHESETNSLKGTTCAIKICKVNERICQIRLDFSHFVIMGMYDISSPSFI